MAAEQRTFLFLVLEGTETIDSGDENCHHKIKKSCMVAEGIIFFTKKTGPETRTSQLQDPGSKMHPFVSLRFSNFKVRRSVSAESQSRRCRMNWNELISE